VIGKEIINPIGMIAVAALMLQYNFQLEEEAADTESSFGNITAVGRVHA